MLVEKRFSAKIVLVYKPFIPPICILYMLLVIFFVRPVLFHSYSIYMESNERCYGIFPKFLSSPIFFDQVISINANANRSKCNVTQSSNPMLVTTIQYFSSFVELSSMILSNLVIYN